MPLRVPAMGRQRVMHRAGMWYRSLLDMEKWGFCGFRRHLSPLPGLVTGLGLGMSLVLCPRSRVSCAGKWRVLPVLPCRLSISSKLTSNYMVNGINVKSSSLSSLRLNASLRQRHLMALQAESCLCFKPE